MYRIKNYTINSDGRVDVAGNVNIFNFGLTKLPLKFGKVSGYFDCSSNSLITLEGCPKSVGGHFFCSSNHLTKLEGCTQSIGGDFDCGFNQLISLEGCPKSVGGDFNFRENKLKDLYGFRELN